MSSALREPYSDLERQHDSAVFAMWLFLATEVLFFGGLFTAYAVYREIHAPEFVAGARETEVVYGAVNTGVLLTSSLTMALAARASRGGLVRFARACLFATMVFGCVFLVLKGFEYSDDISKNLLPGPRFAIPLAGAKIFWTFYWLMTVIHAIHLSVGIGLVARLLLAGWHDGQWLKDSPTLDVTALYWHFVDIVWVFLLPLLYLAGRSR